LLVVFSLGIYGTVIAQQTSTSLDNNVGVVSDNPTVLEENWNVVYSPQKIVPIFFDSLTIPIEIEKPILTMKHKKHGSFIFSNKKVRSVSRSVVSTVPQQTNTVYNLRPTLYISICGASFSSNDLTADPNSNCQMQEELQDYIINTDNTQVFDSSIGANRLQYQFRHWAVSWSASKSNLTQIKDLADQVEEFLKDRVDAWDIVLIGFSRGGIFAHELTKHLVKFDNVDTLHTFLLDPTGSALIFGDEYPVKKATNSSVTHFASLYFDDRDFVYDAHIETATTGDREIDGYDNYGRRDHKFDSDSHENFARTWMTEPTRGLARALGDVRQRKDTGSFTEDGVSGDELIVVRAESDWNAELDMDIEAGKLWGNLQYNGNNLASISVDVNGENGIDAAYYSALVGASRMVINRDIAYLETNSYFYSQYLKISNGEINTQLEGTFYGVNLTANRDEIEISVDVAGIEVSSTTDTALTAISPATAVTTSIVCGIFGC